MNHLKGRLEGVEDGQHNLTWQNNLHEVQKGLKMLLQP